MDELRCCICGVDRKRRGAKRARPMFFQIPNETRSAGTKEDKILARQQRDSWLSLLGNSIDRYPGKTPHICAKHFHSGRLF